LSETPLNLQQMTGLARQHQAAGRFSEAARCFREVVQIAPRSAPAWTDLGALLFMAGQVAEAINAFEKAAALDPANAAMHFNLALALSGAGENGRALEALDRALRLQPGYAEAWNQRGGRAAVDGERGRGGGRV